MPYRIHVKRDTCIGSKNCVHCAPGTFALDEETIAVVLDPAGEPDELVLEAAQVCPVDAIEIFNDTTGERLHPPSS